MNATTGRRTLLVGALVSLLGAGCNCGPPPGADTVSCAEGLWSALEVAATSCPCLSSSPEPECKATDCSYLNFLWLRGNGTAIQGGILRSKQPATFSLKGVTSSSFSIDGGSISISPPNSVSGVLKCSESDLVTDTLAWKRAPASMQSALEVGWDGGAWLGHTWDAGS